MQYHAAEKCQYETHPGQPLAPAMAHLEVEHKNPGYDDPEAPMDEDLDA
ncbi:MAG: hypothetical protein LPK25_15065 [Cyclobacteriaceae bacterium]|nr:hypothetical protein [Cyclobacteriaceae bacterium]